MLRSGDNGAWATSAVLVVSIALAGAACGQGAQPARSLRVDAARDGTLRFERTAVRTAPGPIAITMANPSAIPHAVAIRGNRSKANGETVGQGGTSRIEADLKPGRYELFCPVGGHEQAGMTATLTVR